MQFNEKLHPFQFKKNCKTVNFYYINIVVCNENIKKLKIIMLKKIILDFLTFGSIGMLLMIAFSCSDKNNNIVTGGITYDANSINGTVTFVDSVFISDTTHGYYSVDAYSVWPPTAGPTAFSKIHPTKSGGKYSANFKIIVPSDGSYILTTSFIKTPYVPGSSVLGLGMYDVSPNDTTHSASVIYGNHPKATISGGTGIGNINYNSWIDTTKYIYKF
jgi:hypothetical protein